ncbi:hypothetical protein ABL78_1335 [Leptomonas seymouri]|uniref:Uncharacterized protein n=1 Tax=Leptomonas seymouri TaxID=5684 RepID=A0A0N0P8I5_LEPSE|nr:hypothetical protein ABL78_1335 [Leptomonas seymouri]|eukprot:KPI89567.1 hypothetical protein ABL78_1335 [Leptomonas seymouri]
MYAHPLPTDGWQSSAPHQPPPPPQQPPPPLADPTTNTSTSLCTNSAFASCGSAADFSIPVSSHAAPDCASAPASFLYPNPYWTSSNTDFDGGVPPPQLLCTSASSELDGSAPAFPPLFGAGVSEAPPLATTSPQNEAAVWSSDINGGNFGNSAGLYDGHHLARPSLSIELPVITADLEHNENEEGIAYRNNAGMVGAEEDEQREGRLQQSRQPPQNDSFRVFGDGEAPYSRLHLRSFAPGSGFTSSCYSSMDPITAALARRQQQLYQGGPRSPLSPRTLQALCNASAEGRRSSFLAQLTPDDVLAPPPLALTWYPPVPPGETQHADRKRRVNGEVTTHAMTRHGVDALMEEGEEAFAGNAMPSTEGEAYVAAADVPLPPLRRARFDSTAASASASAPGIMTSSGFTGVCPGAVAPTSKEFTSDSERSKPERKSGDAEAADDAADSSAGDARASAHTDTRRKRERSERVYEYMSHGRRLN